MLIVAAGLILLLLLQNVIQETISRLVFLYFFVALAYRIDTRLPVAAALLLLLGAALAVANNEDFANNLATYGYYFLVIGVVMHLIEYLRGEEKEEEQKQVMKKIPQAGKRRIIAIASGKGGVGKTTVAANLGVALSKLGSRVTIVDMDLAMPNLEIITGLRSPPVGLIDVLEGRLGIERVTYAGPAGTTVIPPGVMLDGYSGGNTEKIRNLLKELPVESDYVILDMPPGREAVDALRDNMEALIIMNPDKASVLDGLNMKVLLEKKGVKILGAVLNRADRDERWIDEIERMLETSVVAVIPESRTVKRALENEECFVVAEAESAPSKEIMGLANEIASEATLLQANLAFLSGSRQDSANISVISLEKDK
ncbi:MAG: cell division ATPase MinD [Candidatus Methanoperedens sp.]|nr:cell division ATPase MinD [Candidatus Methanoperedens sp.]